MKRLRVRAAQVLAAAGVEGENQEEKEADGETAQVVAAGVGGEGQETKELGEEGEDKAPAVGQGGAEAYPGKEGGQGSDVAGKGPGSEAKIFKAGLLGLKMLSPRGWSSQQVTPKGSEGKPKKEGFLAGLKKKVDIGAVKRRIQFGFSRKRDPGGGDEEEEEEEEHEDRKKMTKEGLAATRLRDAVVNWSDAWWSAYWLAPHGREVVGFHAATRIQCFFRQARARRVRDGLWEEARDAYRKGMVDHLARMREEALAMERYRGIVLFVGGKLVTAAINNYVAPWAARDIQRVWRGHRLRRRLARYLNWLGRKAQKELERKRYAEALEKVRQLRGPHDAEDAVQRRIWARTLFEGEGWKPTYDISQDQDLFEHIWKPPQGPKGGLRILKTTLPAKTELDVHIATRDKNAWVGVPIALARPEDKTNHLGPPGRPGTITKGLCFTDGVGGSDSTPPVVKVRYNWVPATFVAETEAMQEKSKALLSGRQVEKESAAPPVL